MSERTTHPIMIRASSGEIEPCATNPSECGRFATGKLTIANKGGKVVRYSVLTAVGCEVCPSETFLQGSARDAIGIGPPLEGPEQLRVAIESARAAVELADQANKLSL